MTLKIIRELRLMQAQGARWLRQGRRVALVPTMGALHAGHMSLIQRAREKADVVVVSIYVNPTQFGPREDFKHYPRPWTADLRRCREAGVDVIFAPPALYAEDHSTWVMEERVAEGGEGAQRPGHLRGVATAVLKLLQLVQPQLAVLGHKDAQQLEMIQRMVRDFNLPVKILAGEVVRDRDGLAWSSRNVYLSEAERRAALALPLGLHRAAGRPDAVKWLRQALSRAPGLRLDYVETRNGRLVAAVQVGQTRLLDNVPYKVRSARG